MKRGCLTRAYKRDLQRKVSKMSREEDNFAGNAALMMLFILQFPLLSEKSVRGRRS